MMNFKETAVLPNSWLACYIILFFLACFEIAYFQLLICIHCNFI